MLRFLLHNVFRFRNWKVTGGIPTGLTKFILAVAPHTSNWDFLAGLYARDSVLVLQSAKFLGKESLFFPLWGWFFRALGGVRVDRSKSSDMTSNVAEIFKTNEKMILAIAPEGTRSKVTRLRTGFYYIAKKANVPIIPCGFDFTKKEVVFGEPVFTTESFENDMEKLLTFYRTIKGKHPELGID